MTCVIGSATFSPCRAYRYSLTRSWGEGPVVLFVMLNPSTADSSQDDATIRRCVGFARTWGFGELSVVNLFALRATDPSALALVADPVGPDNDGAIEGLIGKADSIVAAWGAHRLVKARAGVVDKLRPISMCLGRTAGGQPRHPLYAPSGARLAPWSN